MTFESPLSHSGTDFGALSLLLQHRALLIALDRLEAEVTRLRQESSSTLSVTGTIRLARELRAFTRHLTLHFEAEARCTDEVIRENVDTQLIQALTTLDQEHPRLFLRFLTATEQLEETDVPFTQGLQTLEEAIAIFRRHEAREDALFGTG